MLIRVSNYQSGCCLKHSKKEIEDNNYDLSLNRYKESIFEDFQIEDPKKILESIKSLQSEISEGINKLENL